MPQSGDLESQSRQVCRIWESGEQGIRQDRQFRADLRIRRAGIRARSADRAQDLRRTRFGNREFPRPRASPRQICGSGKVARTQKFLKIAKNRETARNLRKVPVWSGILKNLKNLKKWKKSALFFSEKGNQKGGKVRWFYPILGELGLWKFRSKICPSRLFPRGMAQPQL